MTITGRLPWVCSAHARTFVPPTVVPRQGGRKLGPLKTSLPIYLMEFASRTTPPRLLMFELVLVHTTFKASKISAKVK